MLSEKQIELRKHGIGSSEIAAVAGVNPYHKPIEVFAEKTGVASEFEGNWNTEIGEVAEPVIAKKYKKLVNARNLVKGNTMIHHSENWIIATPDYHAYFDDAPGRLVEIKYVGPTVAGEWSEGVPYYVQCQVYWQQIVSCCFFSDVAVSLKGAEPVIFQVEDCPEIRKSLVEIGRDFWFEHVLKGVPPTIDGSEQYATFLSTHFKRHNTEIVPAPPEATLWIAQRRQAIADLKEAEGRKTEAENKIKAFIGENSGMFSKEDGWRATWNLSKSGGTDWKAIVQEMHVPQEIIERHQRPGSRRLYIKE